MPTSEQVRAAAERYATAVSGAERETIVACFAENAEVVDPYPAPAVLGHDGIRGFWDNVFGLGIPQSFTIQKIAVAGDSAAFLFSLVVAVGEPGSGARLGIDGFDVIRVDDDGLIAALTAYWDPASFVSLPAT